MSTLWSTITWNVARTGGFTAYILLTISVAIGLAMTMHWQTPRWPRIINNELHNFLTLLALVFTGVHVLAVILDPFTHFGLNEILLPFVSHYRPVWMAFGIVALYLGLAIGLSTLIRPLIGYTWWRRLHILTLLIFGLVTVHGIATGSDTRTWWGAAIYAVCVLVVGSLLWLRLYQPATAQGKAHPVLAGGIVALILAGTAWAALGPFEPGWNALANNGNGSGSTVSTATTKQAVAQPSSSQKSSQPSTTQPQTQSTFTPSFTGDLQGQMQQRGPDTNGDVTLHLTMNIVNGPQGVVQVVLQGQSSSSDGSIQVTGSQVTLSDSSGTPLYKGQLTSLDAQNQWNMTALLQSVGNNNGKQLQVQMQVQIDNSGQSTGSISGMSATGTQPTTSTSTANF